jgi:acyl-CoA synthetase (NDP forming)
MNFEKVFNPNSIAIVGVSGQLNDNKISAVGMSPLNGAIVLRSLSKGGFKGRIYPINPKHDNIMGFRTYPDVSSVPEVVDLVIVAVSSRHVPAVLEDCVKAGAQNVHILSSGFGETGEKDGKNVDRLVREIVERGRLNIIGPNCIGIQVPSIGMSTLEIRPQTQGKIAFVSQSGNYAVSLLARLAKANIGFSKIVSYGNAMTLDGTDFIEYLGTDHDTEVVAAYLEGVKDGRRLLDVVRRVNTTKPVIICKGGLTESGARAAQSHTGSLGGNLKVWDAFFKQTKAIQVYEFDELVDMLITFLCLESIQGNAAAVITSGGGAAVVSGDICATAGIHIPSLSQTSIEQILQHVSLVNSGIVNPLDLPGSMLQPELLGKLLDILVKDQVIDFIILNYPDNLLVDNRFNNEMIDSICSFARKNSSLKPIVFAAYNFFSFNSVPTMGPLSDKLFQNGVPVYPSLNRACQSVSRFIKYKMSISTAT